MYKCISKSLQKMGKLQYSFPPNNVFFRELSSLFFNLIGTKLNVFNGNRQRNRKSTEIITMNWIGES